MDIRVTDTEIDGVRIIEPDCFEDERGFFLESYRLDRFSAHGLTMCFVQDNHSRSARGVLRGFHYQNARAPQFRLVRCTAGAIWDVVVDLRLGSPTCGRWLGLHLSTSNRRQILIPPEFAHGFAVLSDWAEVQYKCSGHHSPSDERTLAWDDPDVGAQWPVEDPILSARDRRGMSWREYLQRPDFVIRTPPRTSAGALR